MHYWQTYWTNLESLAKEVGVNIDQKHPKGSRIKVALEFDKRDPIQGSARNKQEFDDLYILLLKNTNQLSNLVNAIEAATGLTSADFCGDELIHLIKRRISFHSYKEFYRSILVGRTYVLGDVEHHV